MGVLCAQQKPKKKTASQALDTNGNSQVNRHKGQARGLDKTEPGHDRDGETL